jgi:heme/copper-type cytochrome/quinol oxidase subunit 1
LATVISMPVLLGNVVYLFVDHRNGQVAFGGADSLDTWTGWVLSQPQTLVYALVALGAASDIIVTISRGRHPLRAGLAVGLGLVGVAALAGVTQISHTLTWSGDGFFDNAGDKIADLLPFLLFNGLPTLGVLVVLGLSLLGLKTGRPKPTGALTFSVLGVGMVLTGAAGNLLQRITDLELEGTTFGEGAYVYVTYGAIIVALGAVAHWGPKLWGRRLPDPALHLLALGAFGATVVSSLPLYIAGFLDDPDDIWFVLSMVGHALMVAVLGGFILLALQGFIKGRSAGDDPWDGQTLEWATSSPPPSDNFPVMPRVVSPEPLFDMKPTGGEA